MQVVKGSKNRRHYLLALIQGDFLRIGNKKDIMIKAIRGELI